MADTEQQQVPTQNEENQESEKHEGENGVSNGEQHANGQPKAPEEGANGDASGAADETPVASSVESSPSKPKRSGGGVKSFFSQIFKRKPKEENGQSPKKKEKAKKGAKEAAKAPEQKASDAKESDAAQDKQDQQPEQQSKQPTESDSPAHENDKQKDGDTASAEPLTDTQDILKIDDLKITLEDCTVAPESHSDKPDAEQVAQNDSAEKEAQEDAPGDADVNVEKREEEQETEQEQEQEQEQQEKCAEEEQTGEQTVDDQPASSNQHDEISDAGAESQQKTDENEKPDDDC